MATKVLIKESLFLLNIWGLKPNIQNGATKVKTAVAFTLLMYMEIELVVQLMINWKGLESMESITSFTVAYQVLSKIVIMIAERKKFVELLDKMENFKPLNECNVELKIEIETIYMATRKYMKLFIALIYVTLTAYFLRPFFTISRTLPFDEYHPTNRYKSPQYELQYISQIFQAAACSSIMIGFDGLFVSFIIHINCQFKMIKEGFSRGNMESYGNSLTGIKKIIIHHDLVLRCVKDIKKVYSLLLLNQFLTSGVCICAGLICIIADDYPPNLQNFSKYLIYVLTALLQLFFYCAAGSYLITESESVSQAVYQSNWWMKTQPQLRRAYALIIQRANKTEQLTAGGMFTLNLESFTNVVKTALSFFTFVQALYTKTQET